MEHGKQICGAAHGTPTRSGVVATLVRGKKIEKLLAYKKITNLPTETQFLPCAIQKVYGSTLIMNTTQAAMRRRAGELRVLYRSTRRENNSMYEQCLRFHASAQQHYRKSVGDLHDSSRGISNDGKVPMKMRQLMLERLKQSEKWSFEGWCDVNDTQPGDCRKGREAGDRAGAGAPGDLARRKILRHMREQASAHTTWRTSACMCSAQ